MSRATFTLFAALVALVALARADYVVYFDTFKNCSDSPTVADAVAFTYFPTSTCLDTTAAVIESRLYICNTTGVYYFRYSGVRNCSEAAASAVELTVSPRGCVPSSSGTAEGPYTATDCPATFTPEDGLLKDETFFGTGSKKCNATAVAPIYRRLGACTYATGISDMWSRYNETFLYHETWNSKNCTGAGVSYYPPFYSRIGACTGSAYYTRLTIVGEVIPTTTTSTTTASTGDLTSTTDGALNGTTTKNLAAGGAQPLWALVSALAATVLALALLA